MSDSSDHGSRPSKGNRPEDWKKFLDALDDKLQLGLLDRMQKINTYHFEEDVLYIETGTKADYDYLTDGSHFQQLEVLAKAVLRVDRVKLKSPQE